jgi:hypothetical protein
MTTKDVHVFPWAGNWIVQRAGSPVQIAVCTSKSSAVELAKVLSSPEQTYRVSDHCLELVASG